MYIYSINNIFCGWVGLLDDKHQVVFSHCNMLQVALCTPLGSACFDSRSTSICQFRQPYCMCSWDFGSGSVNPSADVPLAVPSNPV